MNIFLADEEVLIESIINDEGWRTAPNEEIFYNTLYEIRNNSEKQFHPIISDLINKLKRYDYDKIKKEIEEIIS